MTGRAKATLAMKTIEENSRWQRIFPLGSKFFELRTKSRGGLCPVFEIAGFQDTGPSCHLHTDLPSSVTTSEGQVRPLCPLPSLTPLPGALLLCLATSTHFFRLNSHINSFRVDLWTSHNQPLLKFSIITGHIENFCLHICLHHQTVSSCLSLPPIPKVF